MLTFKKRGHSQPKSMFLTNAASNPDLQQHFSATFLCIRPMAAFEKRGYRSREKKNPRNLKKTLTLSLTTPWCKASPPPPCKDSQPLIREPLTSILSSTHKPTNLHPQTHTHNHAAVGLHTQPPCHRWPPLLHLSLSSSLIPPKSKTQSLIPPSSPKSECVDESALLLWLDFEINKRRLKSIQW